MARKSKQDWLQAALVLLGELGADSLTIDSMTTHLGVTKGSFYHHFGNYAGFRDALLLHYENEGTLQIIDDTETGASALQKLDMLFEATLSYSPDVEVQMRAWALQDVVVREVQARIDAQRVAYLIQLYTELTGDATQAVSMGKMVYAIYVGAQQMIPHLTPDEMNAIFDQFRNIFGFDNAQ
ncbi:MAG: TetR/AcrR family transcriptional regulator [Aggregatilineales bacterium]